MSQKSNSGSVGILGGLNLLKEQGKKENSQELKNEDSKKGKKENSKDDKIKRSYSLLKTTIRKLEELQFFNFPEETLENIVDTAICEYYEKHFKK